MFRIEPCSFLAKKANYDDIMRNLKKEFYNLSVQTKKISFGILYNLDRILCFVPFR